MNRSRFILRDGERLDDLLRDNMHLIQRPDQFCFSIDAVLLADFATLKRRDRVYDLGTGTGVIALLMASRGANYITGIEMNPVMADIARRNVVGNDCANVMQVLEADYRNRMLLPMDDADLVVVNPPYGVDGTGAKSSRLGVCTAKHDVTATMDDVLDAAIHLLVYGGRLAMIQRAERVADWMLAMEKRHLRVKRMRYVHSYIDHAAKLVLLEARWHGGAGTSVLPPLVVYDRPGTYTEEVKRIYAKR